MPKRSLPVPEPPIPKGSLPALPLPAALTLPAVPKTEAPALPLVLDVPPFDAFVPVPALGFAPSCPALPPLFPSPPTSTIGPSGPVGELIGGLRSLSAPQAPTQCASVAYSVRRANR